MNPLQIPAWVMTPQRTSVSRSEAAPREMEYAKPAVRAASKRAGRRIGASTRR